MSGKRNRDNDTNIVSSKTIRNDKTNSIRSEKYTSGGSGGGGSSSGGGGGGGDDGSGNDDGSDEEFINFIVGKYNNHIRSQKDKEKKEENKDLWEYVKINKKIDSIDDLIDIGKLYNEKEKKRYNINMVALNKLIEPLTDLKRMIGMPKLKKQILDQIIYFLQDFEEKNTHMMHTIIEGPPGSGKTEVAKILAKIYAKLGFLKKENVHSVRRSDLIGQYLGQTAIKTQKAIDSAKGGVLLIDEAYSLGNPEGRDSYSKECIDTINQNLSESKSEFICVIVGYKKALKESFFSYNPGLERRFPFRYTIDEYTHTDLMNIFRKLVVDYKWEISADEKKLEKFFEENRKIFEFNGGDLDTLIQCSKIAHSRRVFTLDKDDKKKLVLEDLEGGLKSMMDNEEIAKRKTGGDFDIIGHMYC
jgi:SpoVK/Ycf46/Vps4 family AAA+-type ATPase